MEIYIRPLQAADALVSYAWRNDPVVWKYTGSRPDREITPEIEMAWIQQVLARENEKRYAICLAADNTYIGNVQLTHISSGSAEFHIFIGARAYWGMQLGYKATKLMLEKGTEELKLEQIFLDVSTENTAAVKAYIKCGFEIVNELGSTYRMVYKRMVL